MIDEERRESIAREAASEAWHAHPSHPSSCAVYAEHQGERGNDTRCPCEADWRSFVPPIDVELPSASGSDPGVQRIRLESSYDWIVDPTSTKGRTIRGPGNLRVTQWPDGGLDVEILDGCRICR
jgi:hypothetical protein